MFSDPPALHLTAILSLALAFACAATIAFDEIRRPQTMGIMNLVWPLTALSGSVLWLAGYYCWGRAPARGRRGADTPFAASVAIGTSHCGAGCTSGDIVAEWLVFAVPALAPWLGWHWLFSEKMFAVWVLDFVLAFLIGIVFQYHAIKPMRDISRGQAIVAALKADIASIAAWQVGMYGMMAIIQFGWFRHAYGQVAPVDTPEFWFGMQIAMLAGFCTAYPVNALLIRLGVKEAM